MRFLVTGATGLLGNNLVRMLLARGDFVRTFARATSDERPLAGLDVEQVRGDLNDPRSLASALAGIDVVLHAAGWLHIGWQGLEEARRVNVVGTRTIAEAARDVGARLIYVSSVDSLGIGERNQPADETHARPQPLQTPYVVSKREADEVVLAAVAQGLHAVIVHPGFMLGPWDWKPSSGRMLVKVTKQYAPFAPRGGHSLCDVRDVSHGILAAVEQGISGERYILAGHNISFIDTWRMFARVAGRREPICRLGPINHDLLARAADAWTALRRTEDDFNSAAVRLSAQQHYFSSAKAERELGYRMRPAEESIRDSWNWFAEHGYVRHAGR